MATKAQKTAVTAVASETETKLTNSALSLFVEKGYDGTTIREIIQRAGVTRPVLYYYFENKEALFCRLVEVTFSEFTRDIEAILSKYSQCRDRLKALMALAFERTEQTPEMVRLVLQVVFSPPQEGPDLDIAKLDQSRMKLIVAIMRDGLESGELAGGDPRALALAFSGIMDMYIMAKSHQSDAHLSRELGEGLVDLFIEGAAASGSTLKFPFHVKIEES